VQGLFRLGVSQIGGADTLGVTPFDDRFPNTYDNVDRVRAIHIERGRSSTMEAMQAGSATVLVHDPHGWYNPANTASPLYGLLEERLHPARIRATLGGQTYTVFFGFVRSIRLDVRPRHRTMVAFELVDLFYWLDRDRPTVAASGQTTTGQAIGKILDAVGWVDPQSRYLETGDTIPSFSADGTQTGLQLVENLMETNRGVFFVARTGVATFLHRHTLLLRTSQATIADAMRAIGPGVDFDRIRNSAEVERQGGITQTAEDVDSVKKTGRSEWGKITSPYLQDDNQAASLAWELVRQGRIPRPPIYELRFDSRDANLAAEILARDLADVVTVTEAETGTVGTYLIERIAIDVDGRTGLFGATWLLSRKPDVIPFQIGVSTLGSTHQLVY
jgi:hypothetical protein